MVSISTMVTTLLMYVIPALNGMLTSSTLPARLFASSTILAVDEVPPSSLLRSLALTHTTAAENPGKRPMSLVLSTTSTVPAFSYSSERYSWRMSSPLSSCDWRELGMTSPHTSRKPKSPPPLLT